jgi:DNA-binding MarR family transcriptional regulator
MTIQDDELFAVLWRFLQLAVHRYDSGLTGEVLVVSELASITGLPKSNVSRYVSKQLAVGHLKEVIDPQDRRRRILWPTETGIKEQEWISRQISKLAASIGREDSDLYDTLLSLASAAD